MFKATFNIYNCLIMHGVCLQNLKNTIFSGMQHMLHHRTYKQQAQAKDSTDKAKAQKRTKNYCMQH